MSAILIVALLAAQPTPLQNYLGYLAARKHCVRQMRNTEKHPVTDDQINSCIKAIEGQKP